MKDDVWQSPVTLKQKLGEQGRELEEALAQQAATGEILRVIASSPTDLQAVLNTVAENAARVCGANNATIYRLDGDTLRNVAKYGSIPSGPRRGVPVRRSSVQGRTVIDQATIHIPDLTEVPEEELPAYVLRRLGTRTLLATPLISQKASIGLILIRRLEVRPFSDRQISLFKTFADQAVIAIENARLFHEVETRNRELTESLTQQTATSEILRAIASSPTDLQPVLNTVAENAARICEANDTLIYRVDGQRLRGVADYGPLPGQLGKGPTLTRLSVPSRCIIDRRTIHIHDLAAVPTDDFRANFLRSHGTRTVLATPLLRQDIPIGVILIRRMEVRPFSDRQIALLETFADQAVIAIENVRLFQEIQEKNEQLETASRYKSQFLANMSHELRTPLNGILGLTEMILDKIYGEVPEKIRSALQDVQASGHHLLNLINDVLDLSKIEAGRVTLSIQEYSMREVVQAVFTAMQPLAVAKNLTLKIAVSADLPPGKGDQRRITQVLMNLVGNAVKFADSGEVRVKAGAADGSFLVVVSDDGPGIAPADQQRIFEEFQQVDGSSSRAKGGTGLGLAIAKRIIEMHGGRIWVESKVGTGSTFTFTLPARVERQVEAS